MLRSMLISVVIMMFTFDEIAKATKLDLWLSINKYIRIDEYHKHDIWRRTISGIYLHTMLM